MNRNLLPFLCLLFWVTSPQAAPVTWTLDGVSFDAGGVATGSFVFDANSNAVLDWNVNVSGGNESVFPAFNYAPATVQEVGVFDTGAGGQSFQFFVDPAALGGTPESRLIAFVTDAPLTNAGGTVSLLAQVMGGGNIWQSGECFNCSPFRSIVSGSISGSPSVVHIPTGIQLYGTSTGFGSGGGTGGSEGPMSGTGGGNFSQFHWIDITTGVATEISMDIGFGGDVGGLAADSNNLLFAGTGGRGPNSQGEGESPTLLFTIDPINGLANLPEIGPLGIEFGPPDSAGLGPGLGDFDQFGSLRQNISGWSFDPLSGVLYGMAARGSQLFFVADITTGVATRVGTPCDSPVIGVPDGPCRRGNAIAFDDVGVNNPLGTLFWANDVEVAELNPASGLIIRIPAVLDFSVFGPPANPDAPFRVVAMDFHPLTGDLYTAVQQGQADTSPPAKSTLAILDPLVGTFTIVGVVDNTGVKLDGIAFTHPGTIVNIDIKPGSDQNAVNPGSMGVIPVAILTTDTFDATTADPSTVQFGPGSADIGHGSVHFEDVDDDGDLDLLLHFPTQETGITCGETDVSLSGAKFDGTLISGSDSIVTVGCSGGSATNEIFVIAVSGSLVGLNGTYAQDCILDGGGVVSSKEVWIFLGNTINTTTTEYKSSDCTTVTTVSTLSATFELAGTDINIVGWRDDLRNNVLAPLTANNSDGTARLSDTESVSPLTATIIATTGDRPGPPTDSVVPIFWVVDDTGTNNILYGADEVYNSGTLTDPEASISNTLIKQ